MNNPEIWTIKMANHPQDDFVRFSAYKALELQKAELMVDNARLKAEVERLRIERNGFEQAMKANQSILETKRDQVERLTKTGDAMASLIKYEPGVNTFDPIPKVVKDWNAAKEGKPSA